MKCYMSIYHLCIYNAKAHQEIDERRAPGCHRLISASSHHLAGHVVGCKRPHAAVGKHLDSIGGRMVVWAVMLRYRVSMTMMVVVVVMWLVWLRVPWVKRGGCTSLVQHTRAHVRIHARTYARTHS